MMDRGPAAAKVSLRSAGILAGVMFTVVPWVYRPALDGDFVFDDHKFILENTELWQGSGFDFRVFADRRDAPVRTNYRPVRFLSYQLDALLTRVWFGEVDPPDPFFFHLQSILWHALNGTLIGLLLWQIFPGIPLAAVLGAALAFALHPVHTESVAYISGRRDVLFLAFYLAALLVTLKRRGRAGWGTAAIVTCLYLLALGSKEMAVTLPVAIVLVELLAARARGDRIQLPGRVLAGVALAGGIFVAGLLWSANPGGGAGYWGGSLQNAGWTALRASVYYLRLLLWPSPLTVDYSDDAFTSSTGPFDPISGLLALVFVVSLLGVGWWAYRRERTAVAIGILLFYVCLAPVAQIVPHPERMAERFLYLPSLGFLLAVGGGLASFVRRAPAPSAVIGILILILMTGLVRDRLWDWQGPYPLWKSAVETFPRCARAHVGLGKAAEELGYRGEAVEALGRAVAILDGRERTSLQQGYFVTALTLRASILGSSSEPEHWESALADYERLLLERDTPGGWVRDDPVILEDLMVLYDRLERDDACVETARRVLRLDSAAPQRLRAAFTLARVLLRRGEAEGAWQALNTAEENSQSDRERGRVLYAKGEFLKREKRFEDARVSFATATRLYAHSGNWMSARYMEGECLVALGRHAEAREVFTILTDENPPHAPSCARLAEFATTPAELDHAAARCRNVLAHDPEDRIALATLELIERKRLAAAVPATPPERDPKRATELRLLALKLIREQELTKAITVLRQADDHAEGPRQRANRLEIRLTLARLLTRTEDWQGAHESYVRYLALADKSERAAAVVEAAAVLVKLDRFAEAYRFLHEERRRGVEHPRLVRNLAELAVRLRKIAEATRWYRVYLDEEEVPDEERRHIEATIEVLEAERSGP